MADWRGIIFFVQRFVYKEKTRTEQIDMTEKPQPVIHENMIDIGNIWLALREDTRSRLKLTPFIHVRLSDLETEGRG